MIVENIKLFQLSLRMPTAAPPAVAAPTTPRGYGTNPIDPKWSPVKPRHN